MERLGWRIYGPTLRSDPRAMHLPPVYLITDRRIATPDLYSAVEAALKGGVRMVQLREKDLSAQELKRVAEKIIELTRFYGARLLLNGQPELAHDLEADGVQLGVNSCQITVARKLLGEKALIGYSAHSTLEVEAAADQGADFVTFSPIYSTASKAQYGPPQGVPALAAICRQSRIPVYALGGINIDRTREVLNAGASGVAFISAILGSSNIKTTTQQLVQEVSNFSAS